MPVDLVLVRHGRSEGNEARQQSKRGDTDTSAERSAGERVSLTGRTRNRPTATGGVVGVVVGG